MEHEKDTGSERRSGHPTGGVNDGCSPGATARRKPSKNSPNASSTTVLSALGPAIKESWTPGNDAGQLRERATPVPMEMKAFTLLVSLFYPTRTCD